MSINFIVVLLSDLILTNWPLYNFWKTSFEKKKPCFSAWASTLNKGLINKG